MVALITVEETNQSFSVPTFKALQLSGAQGVRVFETTKLFPETVTLRGRSQLIEQAWAFGQSSVPVDQVRTKTLKDLLNVQDGVLDLDASKNDQRRRKELLVAARERFGATIDRSDFQPSMATQQRSAPTPSEEPGLADRAAKAASNTQTAVKSALQDKGKLAAGVITSVIAGVLLLLVGLLLRGGD